MGNHDEEEQQPVSFQELKRRWAQQEANARLQQQQEPALLGTSPKTAPKTPSLPSSQSTTSIASAAADKDKGLETKQPAAPPVPPKPLSVAAKPVLTSSAEPVDDASESKKVSFLAQQFERQKLSPPPPPQQQTQADISEPKQIVDPFCDEEVVTDSASEIDSISDLDSSSVAESDEEITEREPVHYPADSHATSSDTTLAACGTVKKTPPPPPPPSKKYHSAMRAPSDSKSATMPIAGDVTIPTSNDTSSFSPPTLPPRPAMYKSPGEGMPALPPRPSASTIARSHTISLHHHHHHHNHHDSSASSSLSHTSADDWQEQGGLRRSHTLRHPSSTLAQSLANMQVVYPDYSHASRRPPYADTHQQPLSSGHRGTIHAVAVSGPCVATGAHEARIWDIRASQCRFSIESSGPNESADKVRSLAFSPVQNPAHEGMYLWVGSKTGELMVLDTTSGRIIGRPVTAHNQPIIFILRYKNLELWSIDEGGILNVWPVMEIDYEREYSIEQLQPKTYRVTPKATSALIVGTDLWLSSGRTIEVYPITENATAEGMGPRTRIPKDYGNITQLVTIPCHSGRVYASHDNGKVSVWDAHTLERLDLVTVSIYGICSMVNVGDRYLWMGYNTGMIYVYDTKPERWVVLKMWEAHRSAVQTLLVDELGLALGDKTLQVISVDTHGYLQFWDGLLAEHWEDEQMQLLRRDYCEYRDARVMICSWNIDARKPDMFSPSDSEKIREWLGGMDDPDIIVVGIQEIVDLESKKQTARSLFASRKKVETLQEANEVLTHRYSLWHDYLTQVIFENYGYQSYRVIKTDQLVGMFSCVFVRSSELRRITHIDSYTVKTGLKVMNKSLHGNKGGVAIRFQMDDSSLCFVNCHLAAGQSHVQQRNADAEGVLKAATFNYTDSYPETFVNGGDGTMILDHEHCFLSGDLNYRINMPREKVLQLLASTDELAAYQALQKEDQLLKQRVFNPLFKLMLFDESPIRFQPTYKYDRNTQFYDSSEKKRVPAWCDRVLYRSRHASNLFYRRHEVLASDHRPISAGFIIQTKTIHPGERERALASVKDKWDIKFERLVAEKKAEYIVDYGLCSLEDAHRHLAAAKYNVAQALADLLSTASRINT